MGFLIFFSWNDFDFVLPFVFTQLPQRLFGCCGATVVFPSFRLKGKKPLSASIMAQKYLRPAAVKAGVIKEDERVRFGFHNFRHSLASALVKLKCDPKTVQGILRHEDVRTTMQLYAQSDQESKLEAQGKFLELLLGDKAHLLRETIQ